MKKAQAHKEELVRTAMRLFRQQGYASTGLNQILAESGAPKGSLYYYFPNGKEALGEAAVELAGKLIAEMLADVARRRRTPRSFVRGYCEVMAGWMEESAFGSGCPIATTLLETAPASPGITEAGCKAIDGWIEIIAGAIATEEMGAKEARTRAQMIIAAMEGALILSRIRGSTRPILDVAKFI